jgi:hypothetical protein
MNEFDDDWKAYKLLSSLYKAMKVRCSCLGKSVSAFWSVIISIRFDLLSGWEDILFRDTKNLKGWPMANIQSIPTVASIWKNPRPPLLLSEAPGCFPSGIRSWSSFAAKAVRQTMYPSSRGSSISSS